MHLLHVQGPLYREPHYGTVPSVHTCPSWKLTHSITENPISQQTDRNKGHVGQIKFHIPQHRVTRHMSGRFSTFLQGTSYIMAAIPLQISLLSQEVQLNLYYLHQGSVITCACLTVNRIIRKLLIKFLWNFIKWLHIIHGVINWSISIIGNFQTFTQVPTFSAVFFCLVFVFVWQLWLGTATLKWLCVIYGTLQIDYFTLHFN